MTRILFSDFFSFFGLTGFGQYYIGLSGSYCEKNVCVCVCVFVGGCACLCFEGEGGLYLFIGLIFLGIFFFILLGLAGFGLFYIGLVVSYCFV